MNRRRNKSRQNEISRFQHMEGFFFTFLFFFLRTVSLFNCYQQKQTNVHNTLDKHL